MAVLYLNKTRFAEHLLPFNFAFGINGGLDLITSTVRLGIERYIRRRRPPVSCPVAPWFPSSLDIRNIMFNSVSRQKLRELVGRDFPHLKPFADCLYDNTGVSRVRRSDGSWEHIPVDEGFSQGCPSSPIFAALVLRHIIVKINRDLRISAIHRASLSW